MRHGCLANLLFGFLLFIAFGGSTYFWFTYFVKGRSLPTPNLIGKTVSEARAICSDLGVKVDVRTERRNSDKVPVDRVVWQNRTPGATSFIKRGTTIRVELSAGPLVLRVPDLDGQSAGTSVLRLGQMNLKIGSMSYVDSAPNARGVLAADPAKETVVQAQTPVSLLVGVPPPPPTYVMPDLIDQALDQIRPALEAHGLIVSTVKYEAYPGIRDGIIIRQYPLRGAPVSSRDPITVVVTRQEETAIVEQTPAAATATH
ncbi:MAG TPA: PASTA domain-containing protein [Thermoanaerobaculia bacterium]|jgi:serine/threonine-protein kinase|nr:PASTA domain-containing protein [Thermoanaerobaculia bacterium]